MRYCTMFPDLKEIKRIRENIGWSQIELANRIGISQSAITKYEAGSQIPSYEIGSKIFEILLKEDLESNPNVTELMATNIITISPKKTFGETLDLMREHSISQIPVVENGKVVGTVSETSTLDLLDNYSNLRAMREEFIENVMAEPLPSVPKNTKLKHITPLLRQFDAILINEGGNIIGIVTKADLLII